MIKPNETIINKDILMDLLSKCDKLNEIEKALSDIGVEIYKDGKYISTCEVMEKISEVYKNDLDQLNKNAIAPANAGARQSENLKALFNNYSID